MGMKVRQRDGESSHGSKKKNVHIGEDDSTTACDSWSASDSWSDDDIWSDDDSWSDNDSWSDDDSWFDNDSSHDEVKDLGVWELKSSVSEA